MLKRVAVLALLALPLAALADDPPADEVSTKPGVIVAVPAAQTPSPLQSVLGFLQSPIGALLIAGLVSGVAGRHLLKAGSDKLLADATSSKHGAGVAAGELVTAHLLASLDKYLEESQHDVVDVMTDPAKRAVAAQSLKERARDEVPGAVKDATAALGSSFLDGAVSAALDAAHLKAQALAGSAS